MVVNKKTRTVNARNQVRPRAYRMYKHSRANTPESELFVETEISEDDQSETLAPVSELDGEGSVEDEMEQCQLHRQDETVERNPTYDNSNIDILPKLDENGE